MAAKSKKPKSKSAGASKAPVVILTTFADSYAAERFAYEVVKQGLAACCNIVPGLTSIYRWEEKIEKTSEVMVVIKTTHPKFLKLKKDIKSYHPYKVPELIELKISDGHKPYLDWLVNFR